MFDPNMLNALKGNVAQPTIPDWAKPAQSAGAGQGQPNPNAGTPMGYQFTPPSVNTHPAAGINDQVPHAGSRDLTPYTDYASAMGNWVDNRPQMPSGAAYNRDAWQATIGAWAAARPPVPDFHSSALMGMQPGPVMTPGGGNGSVPGTPGGPPLPGGGVGMVPGVPGSVGLNPNGNTGVVPPWLQGGPNTQFPTNQGVGSSYGVIGQTPPPTPFGLPGY